VLDNNSLIISHSDNYESEGQNVRNDIDLDEMDNIVGADLLTQIQIDLSDDVLYRLLKKSHREKDIITKEMEDSLKEGVLYSTPEVADIIKCPQSTIRGWITELEDYINPTKQGRFIKLSPASVYKLRMISMLREDNQYSVAHLKKLTLGVEVINNDDDGAELTLSQKVNRLEKQMREMTEVMKVMGQLIDLKTFYKEGKIVLNKETIIPMLEDSTDERFAKLKEEVDKEIKDKLNDEIKATKRELNELLEDKINNGIQEYKREVKSYTAEEVKRIMEERRPKSLFERIFGKKK